MRENIFFKNQRQNTLDLVAVFLGMPKRVRQQWLMAWQFKWRAVGFIVTCMLPVLHFSQLLRLLSFTQTDSLSDLCTKQEQQLRIVVSDNTTMLWNLKKTTQRKRNRHNRKVWKHPVGFDSGFGCHTCRKKKWNCSKKSIFSRVGRHIRSVKSSWLLSDCTSKKKKDC